MTLTRVLHAEQSNGGAVASLSCARLFFFGGGEVSHSPHRQLLLLLLLLVNDRKKAKWQQRGNNVATTLAAASHCVRGPLNKRVALPSMATRPVCNFFTRLQLLQRVAVAVAATVAPCVTCNARSFIHALPDCMCVCVSVCECVCCGKFIQFSDSVSVHVQLHSCTCCMQQGGD